MLCIDYRTRRRTGRSEKEKAIGNGYASGSENRKVGFLVLALVLSQCCWCCWKWEEELEIVVGITLLRYLVGVRATNLVRRVGELSEFE